MDLPPQTLAPFVIVDQLKEVRRRMQLGMRKLCPTTVPPIPH